MAVRAERVIPLGSQTFSKSRITFPENAAPLYVTHGLGGRVWDIDGNEYVDMIGALMPVVLGYCDPGVDAAIRHQLTQGISFSLATPLETELAERLVRLIPCAEKVRFAKNGSDVTAAAVRLARAFTSRDRIAICGYHGWQDWYIGSTTRDKGVPVAVKNLSHKFPYNNLGALETLLGSHRGEFAAVILEPMNAEEPKPGYLDGVKALAHEHGALLIFDEIVTGFRYALGGAQSLFGVTPDLATFGKSMGNGMPIAAVVGRADIMAEMEDIFFSGTFGGETLSLASAIAVIDKMEHEPVIETLWQHGRFLADGVTGLVVKHGLEDVFSLVGLPPWKIVSIKAHKAAPMMAIKTLFVTEMLRGGVLMSGSHNVNFAHTSAQLGLVLAAWDRTLGIVADALDKGDVLNRLSGPPLEPIFKVR
jgi:glutamate-1-semialdehyde 2,1-aminomutase/spore coat polysaccharide biosynthesis protein SpsF